MFRFVMFGLTTLLLGGGALVFAADIDAAAQGSPPALTLRHAVERALEHNAQLKAGGAAGEAERARGDAFVLAPEYRIGAEFENFAGSGDLGGIDSLESTLSLSSVIELGDKRDRRRDVAATRLEIIDVEHQARRLDVAAAVARRYVDVARSEALVALGHDNAAIAARIVEAVRARAAAARASRAEVAKAEITLARAQLDEQAAAGALRGARVTLASLWGAQAPDFGATTADLYRLPTYESFAALAARIDQNPDLLVFTSQMRLEDARVRLAETARRADLGWSAGIRRLEEAGDQGFVVGFELPLGSAARAEPSRREAAAERDRLLYEAQARRLELHAMLFTAYEQLEQARSALTTLRETSSPLAEEALRLSELGYRSGRYSLLELTDAQAQQLDVRAQSIAAGAEFFGILIEIQRLTGEAVVATITGD